MDLKLLILICFVIVSSCLLFPTLYVVVKDKEQRNKLIKIIIGLIVLSSFVMIKIVEFLI
jgi:hypothetical protein